MAAETEQESQIARNARRCEELRRRVAALSITETSRDGLIKVTVSADGVPTDIVLAERRNFVPMAQVSAEIMGCLRRAQARIPALLRQVMAETMGKPDAGTEQILADSQDRFPPAPPEPPPLPRGHTPRPVTPPPPAPAPPPSGQPPKPRYDSDWDDRPVLESLDGDGR